MSCPSANTRCNGWKICDERAGLDRRVKAYGDELVTLTRRDAVARRLATIPGIGAINATALLAAVGVGRPSPGDVIWRPGWG